MSIYLDICENDWDFISSFVLRKEIYHILFNMSYENMKHGWLWLINE